MSRITQKTLLWVLIVLLAGASAATAGALDERINIALQDAPGRQVLQSFGQILQADEVRIDPAITGNVTITLNNNRVRTVIDAVCVSLGCRWSFEGGVLEFSPDPDYTPPEEPGKQKADPLSQPIDLALEDAPIRDVLQAFGRIANVRVEIAPEVQGTMSVKIQNKPARLALEQICREHDFLCEINISDEEGALLRVLPRTDAKKRQE
jgi:type II secretory pathway component GspD/PulD (secretin)